MSINEQNTDTSPKLTLKQEQVINALLRSSTIDQASHIAEVSRSSIYKWLKEDCFIQELKKRRNEISTLAVSGLGGAFNKAVSELVGLMDKAAPALKRLICKDIIEYNIKVVELEDVKERMERIERMNDNVAQRVPK